MFQKNADLNVVLREVVLGPEGDLDLGPDGQELLQLVEAGRRSRVQR